MKRKIFFAILIPVIQGVLLYYRLSTGYTFNYLSIITFVLFESIPSVVIWTVLNGYHDWLVRKTYIVWNIVVLIFLDQMTKIIVSKFMTTDISIIADIFKLHISKNYYHNALMNFSKVKINRVDIGIYKLFLIIIFFIIYKLLKKRKENIYFQVGFILLYSASISNLIDTCMWGYTLDFINFEKILTMDLKDLYVDIGGGFILYYFFESDIEIIVCKYKKKIHNKKMKGSD